jgi:hypothetical protein
MAWALLTHTAALGNSTTVTTSAINTTGAALIVVVYEGSYNLNSPFIVTDSASNTNWFSSQPARSGVTVYGESIFFIPNPTTNASHTFSVTGPANTFPGLAVACFSGVWGGAEKVTSQYTPTTTTVLPGSITPTANNALLVTGYSNNGGTGTNTINASFTVADTLPNAGNAGPVALAYLIQTSAAAANPTWTTTGSNINATATMVSFLLGGAGGSGGASAHTFVG